MSPMTGMRQLSMGRPMMTTYKIRTKEEYEERVVRSIKPTLVMWHKPSCSDCKDLFFKLEDTVDLVDGLDLVKADVTYLKEQMDEVMEKGFNAVPTITAMIHGEKMGSITGPLNDEQVRFFVKEMLRLKRNRQYNNGQGQGVSKVPEARTG